jgi:uncharacterized protein YjiS (DUF1127 family)
LGGKDRSAAGSNYSDASSRAVSALPPSEANAMQTWITAAMACWRAVDQILRQWRRRSRERAALAGLNDRELRDIGVTKHDARREIEKPFWRA